MFYFKVSIAHCNTIKQFSTHGSICVKLKVNGFELVLLISCVTITLCNGDIFGQMSLRCEIGSFFICIHHMQFQIVLTGEQILRFFISILSMKDVCRCE